MDHPPPTHRRAQRLRLSAARRGLALWKAEAWERLGKREENDMSGETKGRANSTRLLQSTPTRSKSQCLEDLPSPDRAWFQTASTASQSLLRLRGLTRPPDTTLGTPKHWDTIQERFGLTLPLLTPTYLYTQFKCEGFFFFDFSWVVTINWPQLTVLLKTILFSQQTFVDKWMNWNLTRQYWPCTKGPPAGSDTDISIEIE